MEKFRIKVDLSAFFADERKYVHVLVDPCWENVVKLQERVEQIFGLKNLRFITNEGCFVPPQESIEVVKRNDVLKAFVPSEDCAKNQKKKHRKEKVLVNVDETLKKRKFNDTLETGFASSTPNQAKRSKSVLAAGVSVKNSTVNEITSTNEQLGLMREMLPQMKNNSVSKQRELDMKPTSNNESNHGQSATYLPVSEDTEKNKNKRKNKKKKKNKDNEKAPGEGTVAEESVSKITAKLRPLSNMPSSTFLSEGIEKRHSSQKKPIECTSHQYFNETGEAVTTTTDNNASNEAPAKIIFRCPISDVPYDKPRVFSISQTDDKCEESDASLVETTQSINEMRSARSKAKSPIIIRELIVITQSDPLKNPFNVTGMGSTMKTVSDDGNANGIEPANETNKDCSTAETMDTNQDDEIENEPKIANETNNESSEVDNTNAADDSSVIAIESEYEDDSEGEEKSPEKTYEEMSEIIDLNASDEDSQEGTIVTNDAHNSTNTSQQSPNKTLSIKKMLPFSTALEALPVSNEIVLFKLIHGDGKITGYIAGQCLYTNKRLKIMKLRVIDGQNEIPANLRHLICDLDDSTSTGIQFLQVKMSDMIDAKLFQTDEL